MDVRQSNIESMGVDGSPSVVYLMDCIEGMKQYEDNHFDLAVVDPPYGINIANSESYGSNGGSDGRWERADKKQYEKKEWDKSIPDSKYFEELKRVSRHQIIWGWNYFVSHINNCPSYIVWDKQSSGNYSECESAWCSHIGVNRVFRWLWNGFRKQQPENRIHPTQKPVALYDWIFKNYAEEGQKILDTHLGSGSSRIAANKAGLDFTGFEVDEDYFNDSEKRFKDFISQLRLFEVA